MRLLIVDDDADLARLIGYSVRVLWPDSSIATAPDGATALRYFAAERADLVILDVLIPPPDGFEVCRQLRQSDPTLPIMMLTTRDTVIDEVRAFDRGADDYLTKPFDHLRLLVHLRALARRAGYLAPASDAVDHQIDELLFDFKANAVWLRDERLELTPTEYMLLETLGRNAGRFIPSQTLLEHVWGHDHAYGAHYLKVFINRLRRKLGDDATNPRYIETKRGIGYRLIPTTRGDWQRDTEKMTASPLRSTARRNASPR